MRKNPSKYEPNPMAGASIQPIVLIPIMLNAMMPIRRTSVSPKRTSGRGIAWDAFSNFLSFLILSQFMEQRGSLQCSFASKGALVLCFFHKSQTVLGFALKTKNHVKLTWFLAWCDHGRIQTCDRWSRNPVLYSAELRSHNSRESGNLDL